MSTRRYGDDEVREIFSAFGANMLRLPRWARQRERQMAEIAEHAVTMLSSPQVNP